jgi:hypothetical protein
MADVFSKSKRSEVMSRIRSRGNKHREVALAKLLRQHKITGWRRHVKIQVTVGKWQVTRKNKKRTSPRPSLRSARRGGVILWDDDPGRYPGLFFQHGTMKRSSWKNGAEVKLEIFGNCGMLAGI